jgi:hypothetical protein
MTIVNASALPVRASLWGEAMVFMGQPRHGA